MLLGKYCCALVAFGLFVSCLPVNVALSQDVEQGQVDDASVREFFAKFEAATKEESADRLLAAFDFDELLSAVIEESGVEVQDALRNQMRVQIEAMMRRQFEMIEDEWIRHNIVDIRWTEDRTIAEVFVRHWSSDLTTTRTVFFLKRTDRGLRIFDLIDQSIGFGTVSLTAALLRDGMKSSFPAQVGRGLKVLFKAMMAAIQQDPYETEDWLNKVVGASLPPMIESLRWNLRAAIFLESDPVEALECIDKVVAFNDRVVMAPYLRASAHLNLGNNESAVRYANEYLNQFGGDADAFYILGLALTELDRKDDAIKAYQNGLKDTPEALALVEVLALILPPERKKEFIDAFRNLPDPMGDFEYLADSFEAQEDGPALSALIEAALQITEDIPNLEYYRSYLMILDGEYSQAFDRIVKILDDEDNESEYRFFYESMLCDIAVEVDRVDDAYEVCEDKYEALSSLEFAIVSSEESVEKDEEREMERREIIVDKLYERYAQDFPGDPETWATLAGRADEREDYEQAIKHYRKALEISDADEGSDEYTRECVRCYVLAGRSADAYKDLENKPIVFEVLSYQMDRDSDDFLKIQTAHRDQFPADWSVVHAKVQELYDDGKYEELLKMVGEQIAREESNSAPADEGDHWNISRARFYRILSLARLGRTDDALVESRGESPAKRDHLRTLIYGIKGDRKRFVEAYQWCVKSDEYFDSSSIKMYVEIPEDWMPEEANRSFESYRELRRVVFLLDEPLPLSAYAVRLHSEALGMELFEVQKGQLSASEQNYVCQLNPSSVIVGENDCSYFLQSSAAPYYADLMTVLTDRKLYLDDMDDGEKKELETKEIDALQSAVESHRAWFAIDIYAWPQDLESQTPIAIPLDAQQRLARFAKQVLGDRKAVAYHCDGGWMKVCDKDFFQTLWGDDPMATFNVED